ncbi:MAG: two-component sensor histidine kinase [Lysobacteraceae bacterium]|nr:MAG: two-component sensor histidine kinase [Xanthomonadaceae bacterium]
MTPSLKTRLTIPIIAGLVIVGLAAGWAIDTQIRQRLLEDFDKALVSRSDALVAIVGFDPPDDEEGEELPFVEFDFDAEMYPDYLAGGEAAMFQLWLPEDTIRSESLGDHSLPEPTSEAIVVRDHLLPDGRSGRLTLRRFAPNFDEDWGPTGRREANFHQQYPSWQRPQASIAVAVSREPLDDTLAFVRWSLVSALLGMVVLVSLLAWVFVDRGLQPLMRLVGRLSLVDSERLDQRLPEHDMPEEITPLALTMNSMLGRLEQAFQRERLFSRNVAHELRTPIAELQSIGEVGAMCPDDAEANARFFSDISRVSQRMDLMVTNLLMMARHESGQIECTWESVDLVAAMRNVSKRFSRECEERGTKLDLSLPESMTVKADKIYLDIVLSNLVSNAIHHGANGTVRTELVAIDGNAALAIENEAADLEQEDLPHLFDRFWRKDHSRTSDRHVGLGLPLVKTLAEVCGWSVNTELTDDRRFTVRIDQFALAE